MFPRPLNEQRRLQALASYGVLDSKPEPEFDALTAVARQTFSVPTALISLVDAERQWFKSHSGLKRHQTPRESAFCAHTIMGDDTLVVHDTKADPRFCTNALVMGEPGVRFYAGAPLVTPEGFRLGSFCLTDSVPRRDFGPEQAATLQEFARIAMRILELRRRNLALSALNGEREAAQSARQDALALAAHEIAAPVSTVVSLAQAVGARSLGPLSEQSYGPLLDQLKIAAAEVGAVTERMLTAPQVSAGEIALKETRVELGTLLDAARGGIAALATAKGVSLASRRDWQGLAIEADETLTRRMLSHLLANAVRFSSQDGSVRMTVVVEASGELELQVWDDGPGIGDEVIVALAKGERAGSGLSLVKRLIELHGGRLALSRHSPAGTVASLRFPAYRVRAEEQEPALTA